MEIEPGASGQFDVLVGDDLVASQGGGLLGRLLGRGFPDEAEAVAAVKSRLAS